jgi:periplasmic divalent cation tolerance protein
MRDVLVVLCTVPTQHQAQALAERLVSEHCAACVTILGPSVSVYRWQGAIETASEYMLIIKTPAERYGELEQFIRNNHPYKVPEIIALPVERGLESYLEWVRGNACKP